MKYFQQYYSDVNFEGAEEVKVLCPFHSDTAPSASINTEKNLFHCWVCGVGHNETQFIAKLNNISIAEASKVLENAGENTQNWGLIETANLWADGDFLKEVKNLGLSEKTISKLNLGMIIDKAGHKFLGIPVYYNKTLMEVRQYNLLKYKGIPKILAGKGVDAGFVVPYDLWIDDPSTTYIFEGEKDMLIARELGLNAITLTGGAGAKPNNYVINSFEGKHIVICYDNDTAGKQGAEKLYLNLKSKAASIKYIDIGEVVKKEKEDFFDYIHKYNGDIFGFMALPEHEFKNVIVKNNYTQIKHALKNNILKKALTSKVLITAVFEDSFAVPAAATFEKVKENNSKSEMMALGETKSWYLDAKNVHNILELIEVSASKEQVIEKLRKFAAVPPKEYGIKTLISDYRTIYKTRVMDSNTDGTMQALDLYSFSELVVGKQYEIEYKLYPHPTKHQKLVAIASDTKDLSELLDFTPNPALLSQLQADGTVEERLDKLYQSAKHYVAKHLNYDLWLTIDLVFNSILEYQYQDMIRGALDIFILGDTQVGKSETSSKLVDLYNFGHFLSLKTSTETGLIGGSGTVNGAYVNTLGAIPRQHKRLVVMEEFSGAPQGFIKKMTDIRSSGKIRITRVAGELEADCRLRMITISNPINDENGHPRHLNTFPNGVAPITELVKSAEDVSRYDGFFLAPKPTERLNPFKLTLKGEPISKEAYEHKAQWVYTRQPKNVIFVDGTDSYIWEKAQDLNQLFESSFPLFTTTTHLKLSRYAVALASLIVNTDETYENILVTKEIVDYAVNFLIKIYDNDLFKLKAYKADYDSYNVLDQAEVALFQELYNQNATLFNYLSNQTESSRNNLQTVSGRDRDEFNKVFSKLVKHKFIRLTGNTVYPTPKYQAAFLQLNTKLGLDAADTLIAGYAEGDKNGTDGI